MSNNFWSTLDKKKKEELLQSDFWSALSPEKQKELMTRGTTSGVPTQTFSQDNDIAPTRTFSQGNDDIAPVKGGNKNSVFKSGGFSDGVDGVGDFFGDLGQTVLGTAGDLGLGILKGVGRLAEGIVDLGAYGVAGVADLFGADEFASDIKYTAQQSQVDRATKKATDYVDQYSVLGNKADVVSEGLGQVAAILATGGVAGAAGYSATGATALLTGLSGMGSGMSEAYSMGASDGSAVAYGATVGSLEAVSEMIFGGLGKGFKALGLSKGLTSIDDVFAKKLSNAAAKFITSKAGQKVVGNTLEYAVKSGAEGLEEVISGFGSAIAKDAYLMNGEDEKAFGEILKDENLLEQFVVGSIVSGIAQGGDFISSTKNGRDFVTGLSKNEQTVVDKVYEQRLAEESENRTLSNRDKNKLYERVVEEMKKGYISTDEIESILGGKTYEGYKSLTDKQTTLEERKTAIENEIKELVKTPESQFTVEQREKLTSLREEARGIKDELQNLGIKTAKNNLFNEVNKLTSKDTYLRESYNDLARKNQAIEIDENQYKGTKFEDAAKKTIANARNAGASNSNRVRDFVEFSAKYSSVSGTVVDFKDDNQIKQILENQLKAEIATLQKSTTEEDKTKLAEIQDMLKQVQEGKIHVNGVKTKDGVAINLKSPNYLNTVLGHEVTHFLEGKNAYEPLQKAIFKYAQSKGDYEGRRKVLDALYKNVKDTTVDYELTADLVGDYLFTEYDFIKSLSTENRNVFQYVFDQIKYVYNLATAGSKEARELEKVMHQFEKALRESAETSQNVQYHLSKDIENFDNSWYNEIKLPATERDRVQSEALTWHTENQGQPFSMPLSNGFTYLCSLDNDGIVHIYGKEKSVNIHEFGGNYDNRNTERPDRYVEKFGNQQGIDIGDNVFDENGQNQIAPIASNGATVQGEGRSNRTGYSKNDTYAYRKPKAIGWHFNEDGSVEVTYSDGTKEIEYPESTKEVSSTDDAFFDGENPQNSLSYEGEKRTLGGSYRFDGKDFLKSDIAPVAEGVAKNATTTNVAPTEQTLDKKIAKKLKNLQTELENNKRLRDESNADFDEEIASLQAEYDAKKDKNTKVANDLLRRIEKKKRQKADVNATYDARINSLGDRVQKMQTPQYRRSEQRKAKQEQRSNEIRNLIGDTSTWKDKKLGIFYQINTLHRNLRDVVRDANGNQDIAKADEIYEYLQGSYNHNEAQLKRESREIKQKYADMKINKYESEYIQMLGEFKYNPDTKLTFEAVDGYFNKHKDSIDIDKVNKAIEESRKDYDNLIKRVNEVLREQGMKEIGYREGYFPHFTDTKQGWLAKLLNWKTIDTEIPTDIAGLTEEFNPVRTYQSYDKHRKTDETDYNFLKGFDTYVHGALDWIYHIEDIQKRRAFEHEIRYSHSEQGIRDRIDEIRQNETLDDDEARAAMDEVYRKAKNPLNNFVTDLRNSTNNLAGKKSTADREMEYATNRKIYSTMTNISNRVSADMVVGSISSALTNWIPITQSWGQVSPISSLRAVGDVIRNAYRDDGMIKKSDFMTNRLLNEENLNQTGWDKVSNVAGGLMNIFDHISTEVVWRSKYQENLNNGMSEAEAIHNADIFAENVMAGRSRGNMPTIYNSKNPITKMLTAFQLEVGNQYGYMFKDMPQDIGKENIGKLTAGYAKMFIGAYLYNALFSKLTGRDAAFDPIGIIEDLLKDLGFGGDDEEEEVDVMGAISGLGENIAQEIPYIGGLLGGGRVPISSAIPYDNPIKTITGTMEDVADKDWANLTKEWLNLFYYGVLPMGGGQLKKFNEGMAMFSDDHPVSGSYTTSGNLRFPVEDTFGNRVQAALFGQYASKNAREYFDNGYAPLKEKQIEEYMDVDLPIADYWKYREGLSGLKTNAEKADYINSLDIENWQKNLLLNNILDRKEDVDMSNYDDYSDWEEFDYAQKNPDKYAFAKSVGGYSAYRTYLGELYDIKADKDEYGKSISGSRKEKVIEYINNLDADYETKIILFKSEYPSDDTYNMEIINCINNRTDLTYEERVAIFTELGFTVSNGSVYWD